MKTIRIPSTVLRASLSTLALGLFLAANAASAQIPYVGQFQYGVKAGLNVASVNAEDEPDLSESPRLGIGAGLAVRYNIGPSLAIQGEAQYSQKGEKFDGPGEDDSETAKIDYLEIPVLARYAVPLSPLMTAGVFAGPNVSIPISNNLDDFDDSPQGDDAVDPNTEFGVNFGVDVGSGPFYVDGRYNLGLTNIGDEGDAKNRHFQFTFGYWF